MNKIKKGLRWKSIEGPAKGKWFTVIQVNTNKISYRSEESGIVYTEDRKHFEKYIERVNTYWSERNKNYKFKKNKMKAE